MNSALNSIQAEAMLAPLGMSALANRMPTVWFSASSWVISRSELPWLIQPVGYSSASSPELTRTEIDPTEIGVAVGAGVAVRGGLRSALG